MSTVYIVHLDMYLQHPDSAVAVAGIVSSRASNEDL